MFTLWEALNGYHPATAICTKGAERKRWRRFEEQTHAIMAGNFHTYIRPLAMVLSFNYFGRVLNMLDDDWPEAV